MNAFFFLGHFATGVYSSFSFFFLLLPSGDYTTSLLKSTTKSPTKWKDVKSLQAQRIFKGHSDTVEDVTFHPTDHGNVFASVGDDRSLIVWDARVDDPIGKY